MGGDKGDGDGSCCTFCRDCMGSPLPICMGIVPLGTRGIVGVAASAASPTISSGSGSASAAVAVVVVLVGGGDGCGGDGGTGNVAVSVTGGSIYLLFERQGSKLCKRVTRLFLFRWWCFWWCWWLWCSGTFAPSPCCRSRCRRERERECLSQLVFVVFPFFVLYRCRC